MAQKTEQMAQTTEQEINQLFGNSSDILIEKLAQFVNDIFNEYESQEQFLKDFSCSSKKKIHKGRKKYIYKCVKKFDSLLEVAFIYQKIEIKNEDKVSDNPKYDYIKLKLRIRHGCLYFQDFYIMKNVIENIKIFDWIENKPKKDFMKIFEDNVAKFIEKNRKIFDNIPENKQAFELALEKVGGNHIEFYINGDRFTVFDEKIFYNIILLKKVFNVYSERTYANTETKLSYRSISIDKPNGIFNHPSFDQYCIQICKSLLKDKGKEFPIDDYDITVSYPTTIEGIDIEL